MQTTKDLTQAQLSQMSPMMRQYLKVKEEHSDCIIMYRLGDFYEMFFEDAVLVSTELNLTLTGRDCGLSERAPMCGVPYHAVTPYINTLVQRGYRVSICEQTTDPALSKGLVERAVTRIVTPGTIIEDTVLDEKSNSYIVSLFFDAGTYGYAYSDISVGSFYVGEFSGNDATAKLVSELSRISPKEIILSKSQNDIDIFEKIASDYYVHMYDDKAYVANRAVGVVTSHFSSASPNGLGLANMDEGITAAGALLSYLGETQMNALRHIMKLTVVSSDDFMQLDDFTMSNLELTRPLHREGNRTGTLLHVLDKTSTAMGGRLMKNWITQPLLSKERIKDRLDAVEELVNHPIECDLLKKQLTGLCDIQRLCAKLSYGTLNPKHCVAIKLSLMKIQAIKSTLTEFATKNLRRIFCDLDDCCDLYSLIAAAISDEPSTNVKDGSVIRDGYDSKIDEYRKLTGEGKTAFLELEERERVNTGIRSIRIGYNRVFGYYFEVSKSYADQVPDRFIRKQTLANAERYFTDELKLLEERSLSAEENCILRETELFMEVKDVVFASIDRLLEDAELISELDVYLSFAETAKKNNYVKPHINEEGKLAVYGCRHPMVEYGMKDGFNPNDVFMDMDKNRLLIITGPNMAGKSTYMRQTALVVIMAHIGCFVCAKTADICIVDRVFTRVGASDNLSSGQSTFMVEMSEMACILNTATERSLLILDEIGRGTATYDGLSIAWAVVEHIASVTKAKTMFATHYHELTSLSSEIDCIRNYSVAVKEIGDNVVFLHKIVNGGADRSFGIQVAALAGLPQTVVTRSKQLLKKLEGTGTKLVLSSVPDAPDDSSELDAVKNEIYSQLTHIDVNSLTPFEAMSVLYNLKSLTENK